MDKKITSLGKLKGKVLLFGGIYSNLQALQGLMAIAEKEGISSENCICTGDLVGYCAQPQETVQLFRDWGAKSIAGNVELQLFVGAEDCGCDFTKGSRCDNFSKLWYPYAQSKLPMASIQWMGQLPDHITFNFADKRAMVVHGSYRNPSEFIFQSSPSKIKKENFKAANSDLIIAGHCGLPFHQHLEADLWLNPGVIGMPANDGTARVWYMVLEEVNGMLKYTHSHYTYDSKLAYTLMRDNHLPLAYANTLVSGLWDNMEILPEAERKLRGISYNFDPPSVIALENGRKSNQLT